MNAPANINSALLPCWNYRSEVRACTECNGTGRIHAHRTPTINDPYPESPCQNCDGEHEPCCDVCGFDQIVPGFDCLACQTVADLTDTAFARFDPEAFGKAVATAVAARQADYRYETMRDWEVM